MHWNDGSKFYQPVFSNLIQFSISLIVIKVFALSLFLGRVIGNAEYIGSFIYVIIFQISCKLLVTLKHFCNICILFFCIIQFRRSADVDDASLNSSINVSKQLCTLSLWICGCIFLIILVFLY